MAPRRPVASVGAPAPVTPDLHPEKFLAPLSYLTLAVLLVALYRIGPRLSRSTRLPVITLYMLVTLSTNLERDAVAHDSDSTSHRVLVLRRLA